jgi:plasmid stabilization system protein ParE
VRQILWTVQAQADLAAIHAFINLDSVRHADDTVRQLIAAVEQLVTFPESGRAVPEFDDPEVREIVRRTYRLVYKLVGSEHVHILTIHHGSRQLPSQF